MKRCRRRPAPPQHRPAPQHKAPRFRHDCDRCVYLGRFDYHVRGRFYRHDLYWCASLSLDSLASFIARFGDDGPEYRSSHPPEAFCVDYDPSAMERVTLARAIEVGLYRPWERRRQLEGVIRCAVEDLEFGMPDEALVMLKSADAHVS